MSTVLLPIVQPGRRALGACLASDTYVIPSTNGKL